MGTSISKEELKTVHNAGLDIAKQMENAVCVDGGISSFCAVDPDCIKCVVQTNIRLTIFCKDGSYFSFMKDPVIDKMVLTTYKP